MRKISAHGVDLAFDGVARDSPFGPAFGNHGPEPDVLDGKQRPCRKDFSRAAGFGLHGPRIQGIAMQCEMRCLGDKGAGKNRLELGTGLKPLHERQASVQKTADGQQKPTGLDSQAFAALGAACCDDGAAAARFHARQEAVRACAFDFGGLVCAFHDESLILWAGQPGQHKLPLGDSNDLGGRTTQPTLQVCERAQTRCESGKPMIIADFPTLATS